MGKTKRFLKETSDRSGFDNFNHKGKKLWTSVYDDGLKLAPEEVDAPPPSSKSLGGADISGQPRSSSDTYTAVNSPKVQCVTSGGGILATSEPIIYVTGTDSTVDIVASSQISSGRYQQIITVQCVSNQIILENGSGLALIGGQTFNMTSGSIINLIYSGTDNLWHELSRSQNGGV